MFDELSRKTAAAIDEVTIDPSNWPPKAATPHIIVDWPRLGRHIQAARTDAQMGAGKFGDACGVNRAQILQVEGGMALSAVNFARVCTFLGRDQSFFCTTLGGWKPHLGDGRRD